MKLQIFIEEDEGSVILDRAFFIVDGKAPVVELQDIVDDAVKYRADMPHDCRLKEKGYCECTPH